MRKANIKMMVEQLEKEMEKSGAKVRFVQYGGGTDEMMVEATKNGFIYFAVLMLKAAYTTEKKEQENIASEMAALVTPDSDCCFDWFERKEALEAVETNEDSKVIDFLAFVLFLAFVSITVLGFGHGMSLIIQWLT